MGSNLCSGTETADEDLIMAKTKAPSGLGIARNVMKFTLTWKIADDNYNDGQQLQWRTNLDKSGKWTSITIGTTTVSRTITLTAADYYLIPFIPSPSESASLIRFRNAQNSLALSLSLSL